VKKALVVSLALVGMLAVAACAQPPDVTGTVTEKEYEPARKKKAACWELEITLDDGTERDFCVRKSLYDQYQVGDKYPKG
jgi:hypothetical protein